MPITVEWDNAEHTAIRWDLHGAWTIEEIYSAAQRSRDLRRQHNAIPSIYIIIVAAPTAWVPSGVMAHVQKLYRDMDARDKIIRVGGSTFQRALDTIFLRVMKVFGDKVQVCDTLEQARALAARQQTAS